MGVELILPFIGGLLIGSFLNVVILRFDDLLTIAQGRSHCPNCKTTLAWYDLIPLLSFIVLWGKCRNCQKPISYQYPAVELATGLLFAAGYGLIFSAGLPLTDAILTFIFYIIAVAAMVVIFCHDAYEMMIPDLMSYILILAALGFGWFYTHNIVTTFYGGLIGVIPIALLVYPSRGKWMGEGDVKLAFGLGLLVGSPAAIVFLVAAFFSGAAFGLIIIGLSKRFGLKSAVPFGPFLILGAIIALFYGSSLIHWYKGMLGL